MLTIKYLKEKKYIWFHLSSPPSVFSSHLRGT